MNARGGDRAGEAAGLGVPFRRDANNRMRPVPAAAWTLANVEALTTPEPNTGCWLWLGSLSGKGYATRDNARMHRVAYERVNGPIPPGLIVCHRCDTPPCVNPAHLFAATIRDNNLDMTRKGRGRLPLDDRKLTATDVVEMRRLWREGATVMELAKRFGIARGSVSPTVRGHRWRNLASGTDPGAPVVFFDGRTRDGQRRARAKCGDTASRSASPGGGPAPASPRPNDPTQGAPSPEVE